MPNSSSSEDRQLAHKKRHAYQKILQSIRRIHENDGQNKRTQHTVKKEQSMKVPTYIHN